jgi:hypothetical protein
MLGPMIVDTAGRLLRRPRTAWVVLALTLAVAACGTKPGRFYHLGHRKAYAIEDAELRRLQFYVSTKVVAHDLNAQGAQSVILVEEGTPGVAVDSGPNWIRVRFQAGGEGVVFLAPTGGYDSSYLLATEAEDGSGYRLVRNEPDRILRAGSRRFKIISGSEAVLLVDAGDLTDLIEKERTHVGGQRTPK